MGQADQGDHQVDLDPGIQVDQVDQVDLVNLVNLGQLGSWFQVDQVGQRTRVTTKWTWTPGSWVLVPGGPSGPGGPG